VHGYLNILIQVCRRYTYVDVDKNYADWMVLNVKMSEYRSKMPTYHRGSQTGNFHPGVSGSPGKVEVSATVREGFESFWDTHQNSQTEGHDFRELQSKAIAIFGISTPPSRGGPMASEAESSQHKYLCSDVLNECTKGINVYLPREAVVEGFPPTRPEVRMRRPSQNRPISGRIPLHQ
jgi:hypothetical protein